MSGSDRHTNVWPGHPVITDADDQWHELSGHWWETETNWWGFYVPERHLAGALYTQALSNQQICKGGAWVWDDSPAGALYESFHQGLPFPERGDQLDIEFPNGVGVKMVEPLTEYRTTYSDPGLLEVDLIHRGTMPPHAPPLGAWPYMFNGHFDQPMHTTGTIRLHGELIPIDCFSVRDRSWGPRPAGPTPPDKRIPRDPRARTEREGYPYGVAYQFGTADASNAFMASTDPWIRSDGRATDEVDTGYLLQDGVYAPLVAGARTFVLDPETKWVRHIHIEAVDALDRELVAHGELVARWGTKPRDGVGMFRWEWNDGHVGWGEDQTFAAPGWLEALDRRSL